MKQPTEHAPAERAPSEVLNAQITSLRGNAVLQGAAQHRPEHIALLNPQRQIVYANASYLAMAENQGSADVYGARFGEHMGCIHATSGEGACGTAAACQTCGAVNSVLKSLDGKVAMQRCTIPLEAEHDPLQLIIFTIPVRIDGSIYIMAVFVDDNKVIEHPHTLAEHAFAVQRLAARIEAS
jgi:hypothetical protein